MQKTMPDDSLNDYNLNMNAKPLNDSVSSIQWMPATFSNPNPPNMFAVTTWDGSLRVYEVLPSNGSGIIEERFFIEGQQPITSCTWDHDSTSSIIYTCNDKTIMNIDLATGQTTKIGEGTDIFQGVHYVPSSNAILSIGYDKVIKFWQKNNPNAVFTQNTPTKIYVSDFKNGMLAAGTNEEKIMLFDVNNINNFSNPTITDSFLQKKSQLQCMSLNNDATFLSYGSVDGRGNISVIKKSPSFSNSNAYSLTSELIFKANRVQVNNVHHVYPVNGMGFNTRHNKWIFTAGADGIIQFWNYEARALIKSLSFNNTPVVTAKVNATGELIAYALGDDWHQGPMGAGKWKSKIAVHYITETEIKTVQKVAK